MHQVKEIYKKLADVVIDHVEAPMEESTENSERRLAHVVEANEKA
jgi:hypothetical protein